jgi:hypothetical protein
LIDKHQRKNSLICHSAAGEEFPAFTEFLTQRLLFIDRQIILNNHHKKFLKWQVILKYCLEKINIIILHPAKIPFSSIFKRDNSSD